jgi:hypothetical protein
MDAVLDLPACKMEPERTLLARVRKICLIVFYVLLALGFSVFIVLENIGKMAQVTTLKSFLANLSVLEETLANVTVLHNNLTP